MRNLTIAGLSTLALAACDRMLTTSNSLPAGVEMSYQDFQERYPGTTTLTANEVDADADGMITENEIQAARADGTF